MDRFECCVIGERLRKQREQRVVRYEMVGPLLLHGIRCRRKFNDEQRRNLFRLTSAAFRHCFASFIFLAASQIFITSPDKSRGGGGEALYHSQTLKALCCSLEWNEMRENTSPNMLIDTVEHSLSLQCFVALRHQSTLGHVMKSLYGLGTVQSHKMEILLFRHFKMC